MLRRIVCSAVVLLLLPALASAQRTQPSQPRVTTELVVRVTYENDRAVTEPLRVQLSNSIGVPVAETFTRNEGEARFLGVEPGAYRLRVSGMEIEEKQSDYSFIINPRELTHFEYIRVRRRPGTEAQSSLQGSISAAALNIPPKAESEFEKGVTALRKERLDEAQKRFQRAVELYPRYAAAFNNLGVIAMRQGSPAEGEKFFREAVRVDNEYAPPYVNLAKAVVAHQGHAEAELLLLKATSIDPTNAETLAMLAMIEYESNKISHALANARKVHALAGHEKYAFAHYIAGRALESQRLHAEAIAEYHLFIKEAPASPTVPRVRAFIATLEQTR